MTWSCKNCRETNDDDIDVCWHCGCGSDGSPAAAGWRSELDPAPAQVLTGRRINCIRCSTPMTHAGSKKFHEGSYVADMFFGDFFVNRESFDTYACPACGKVEFFVAGAAD